jgi:hypothetical protein
MAEIVSGIFVNLEARFSGQAGEPVDLEFVA